MLEMINLPRPGGWFTRVLGFSSNETTQGSHLNKKLGNNINNRTWSRETVVLSAATFLLHALFLLVVPLSLLSSNRPCESIS